MDKIKPQHIRYWCMCVWGGGGGEALNKETEHSKGPLIDLTAAF